MNDAVRTRISSVISFENTHCRRECIYEFLKMTNPIVGFVLDAHIEFIKRTDAIVPTRFYGDSAERILLVLNRFSLIVNTFS